MSAVFVNERHHFDIGVGHSCGGAMLAWMELFRPGSFNALVLYEPIIPVPLPERISTPLSEGAIRRKSSFESKRDAFDYLGRKSLKCKPETEMDFYLAAMTQRLFHYLHRIRIPVLILAGEHSTSSIGVDQFANIAEAIGPNAEFKIMPNLGHLGPLESPSEFAREVSLFATGVKNRQKINTIKKLVDIDSSRGGSRHAKL
jgi:pimeloyl-ACP methyl ester carboxylesterase